jgi:hypothetical protein
MRFAERFALVTLCATAVLSAPSTPAEELTLRRSASILPGRSPVEATVPSRCSSMFRILDANHGFINREEAGSRKRQQPGRASTATLMSAFQGGAVCNAGYACAARLDV